MNKEKLWKMFSPIMAEWIRNKSEELDLDLDQINKRLN